MSRTEPDTTTTTTLNFGGVSVETNINVSDRDTMSQKVQLGDCHVKSIETSGRQLLHRHMEVKKTTRMKHTETKETRVQVAKATTKKSTRDTTKDDDDVSSTKERLHRVSLAVATELCALIDMASLGTLSLQHGPDPGRIVSISVRSARRPKYRTMKRVRFPTIYEEPDQEVLEETEETEEEKEEAACLAALEESLKSADLEDLASSACLAALEEDATFIDQTKSLEIEWENTYVSSTLDALDYDAPTEETTEATDPTPTTNGSDTERDTDAAPDSTTKTYTLLSPTRLWVKIPSRNATRRVHWGQQSPRRHRHRLATVVEVKESAKVTLRKQTIVLLGSQWSPLQTQQ